MTGMKEIDINNIGGVKKESVKSRKILQKSLILFRFVLIQVDFSFIFFFLKSLHESLMNE